MISFVNDLEQCQRLWYQLVPTTGLFDLWEVRACFQRYYDYIPGFMVVMNHHEPKGLLPLSQIEDHHYWGYFPGETFKGKTWLEQNRIIADTPDTFRAIIHHCPCPLHLRYLGEGAVTTGSKPDVDEVGYLFHPPDYGYCFDRYIQVFSNKSRKSIGKELMAFEAKGVSYRYNDLRDIDRAFTLNLEAFGSHSFFFDKRFLHSFQQLMQFLYDHGLLRVTTVLVGGRIAAIDMGAVYKNVYTVLGGGTDPELLGIAKLINFHHMEWACREHLDMVDFLCGDFGWKERFHLTARPLYQIKKSCLTTQEAAPLGEVLSHVS